MASHNHVHRRHARPGNPFESAIQEAESLIKKIATPAQSTVVSVVYVTATPTFSGDVGGYTTLGVAIDTKQSSTKSSTKAKTTSSSATIAVDTSSKATKSQSTLATSTLPSSVVSPSITLGSSTAILAASNGLSSTAASHSTIVSAASSSSTATAESTSSGGLSTAGKAGLAIGILLLVGAVLAMVLFCFKRKREQLGQQKIQDEKHDLVAVQREIPLERHNSTATNATTRTQATAPRLSLRPVTQFLPNLSEKRASKGNALMNVNEVGNDGWKRPTTNQSNDQANPFGNHAETIDATNASGPGLVQGVTSAGDVVLADNVGPVVAAAALAPANLTRSASRKDVAPKALDFTRAGPFMGPPSPAGTEFSMNSESGNGSPVQTATSVAIAAAGGPANSVVHRVQLDFIPSMADELELRAGQLVRVLHEFDDGWAMCIRLDRSQQGVCPRTCLSARPVKPRPTQPRGLPPGLRAPGPQGRPMTPNGQQGRPMTPQGRPMTPQGLQPRPMTPNGPTGPLPGTPNQRSRSNSAASGPGSQARRPAPAGPSPMNPVPQFNVPASSPPNQSPIGRKPVPGQAL